MRKQRGGRWWGAAVHLPSSSTGRMWRGGKRRRQRKRVKRGRRLGRMPRLPATPGAVLAPPFLQGGSRTPLVTPPVGSATAGIPALAGGAAEGLVGASPRRSLLTFSSLFLELEGVRGLFLDLMACSLVLWGCRSVVRGDSGQQHSHPARIYPISPIPFAWSLSSWLAVFFQSSILSCKGFIRLSMRALEQGERSRECGRALEPGGSHSPIPCPANIQHPLLQ